MPKALKEFVRAEKQSATRATCKVCALSKSLRSEIGEAASQRIPPQFVIRWLQTEYKILLTPSELRRHTGGRHDPA